MTTPKQTLHDLRQFLDYCVRAGLILPDTLEAAWSVLLMMRLAVGTRLPIPLAACGPDKRLMFYWDTDEHHFELELAPFEVAEFFYRNRKTEELWGDDYRHGRPLPDAAIAALKLFI